MYFKFIDDIYAGKNGTTGNSIIHLLELKYLRLCMYVCMYVCMYCMQTSYQLALQIGGPIYVSSGLALTAQAVAVSDGDFEFLSIEEIKEYCPGLFHKNELMYVFMYLYMYVS